MEQGESEKRREGRVRRGCSYLETKLSCLMLVSDVAWSVLKELREEEYGWMGDGEDISRAERDDGYARVCSPTHGGLDVIRTHGRR